MFRWIILIWVCLLPWTARADMMPDIVNAGGDCVQAKNYLARTTGGNEGGNGANIRTLICGLVADGVITGTLAGTAGCGAPLDGLYILAQQVQGDALLNLCGTNFTLGLGVSVFTALQGFTFGASGLGTNFNPTTATSPHLTQNSTAIGVWCYNVAGTAGNGVDFGGTLNNNNVIVANFNATNVFFARINDASGPSIATPGNKGLFSGDRSSSTQTVPYWNGASLGVVSSTSAAFVSTIFAIGWATTYGATPDKLSAAYFGASLGPTLQLALYTRLRTYMTAIGVP